MPRRDTASSAVSILERSGVWNPGDSTVHETSLHKGTNSVTNMNFASYDVSRQYGTISGNPTRGGVTHYLVLLGAAIGLRALWQGLHTCRECLRPISPSSYIC
ncbi:predicted protein [Aspergillus terreus NIH2624]|uniref:Uncharacterized protein n=1 Tax=Aspergillus terreus (strain NIH 2624 / FGSC A1156) TaxID=341663 RepID=Q0C7R5_ASPTN|nr:uncharacterized protein ATEG_10269 [Aspergillus terreus NIH2624]EAU29266.1 predicted protein [Aspergillus terreus NIH2624]